jgi:hypothetical protein
LHQQLLELFLDDSLAFTPHIPDWFFSLGSFTVVSE